MLTGKLVIFNRPKQNRCKAKICTDNKIQEVKQQNKSYHLQCGV
jgi:hypothetical protein